VIFSSSLKIKDHISGLKAHGWLIINSPKAPSEFKELGSFRIATVDANEIALKYEIGTEAAPIVNTVMSGAMAKILGFSLDSLAEAMQEKFKDDKNFQGALEAYKKVRSSG